MRAHPVELRARVADAIDGGRTWAATAERFRVSVAFVGKLLRQRRETGSIAPRRGWTGSPPALDERAVERLRKAVREDSDATLDELRRRARPSCSLPTVFRCLKRLGLKVAPGERAGPRGREARPPGVPPLGRPDPAVAAGVPRRERRPHGPDPDARPGPARRAGLGRGPARPLEDRDRDRGCDARRAGRPVRVRGPDGLGAFRTYVEQVLDPELRRGDVDNLSAHKASGVAEAIRGRGAESVFLPPYSPDLNAVELLWAKVKGRLRSAAVRTTEAIYHALGDALSAVTENDCLSWFVHCGH